MSNFMKIRPMDAQLFHVDRRTDMTQLVAFSNFVKAPIKDTLRQNRNNISIIQILHFSDSLIKQSFNLFMWAAIAQSV